MALRKKTLALITSSLLSQGAFSLEQDFNQRASLALDSGNLTVIEAPQDAITSLESMSETRFKHINLDYDQAFAVGKDGGIYQYSFSTKEWTSSFGLPVIGNQKKIQVPKNTRAFSGSYRGRFNGFYQDYAGNDFHYGSAGCTSFYVLSKSKRDLFLGDPWFPADLSRQVCLPKRNKLKTIGLASAGSVILVMGENANLFWRFYDYDVNGGTPFYSYTYQPYKHGIPGVDANSEGAMRVIEPADKWHRLPRIPSHFSAEISSELKVLQTGSGNLARTFFVKGASQGKRGVFSYKLNKPGWMFQEDNKVKAGLELRRQKGSLALFKSNRDIEFSGDFNYGMIYGIEISDFSFFCSPMKVQFKIRTGEVITGKLHAVDSWTLFEEKNIFESDDDTIKKLKLTLVLDSEFLESKEPLIKMAVDLLRPLHHKTFGIYALASMGHMKLVIPSTGMSSDLQSNYARAGELKMTLHPLKKIIDKASDLSSQAFFREIPVTYALRDIKTMMKKGLKQLDREKKKLEKISLIASSAKGLVGFSAFMRKAIPVPDNHPKMYWVHGLSQHFPVLLPAQVESQRIIHDSYVKDLKRLEEIESSLLKL